jgi:uncharacterized protein YlxW (UPF0749 family)
MSGGQIMVVTIVAIVMLATLLKARFHHRSRREAEEESPETQRLRDEVKSLKERVAVLERIVTDSRDSLAHEIERLRDR